MKIRFLMTLLAGIAIGAIGVQGLGLQGLHAQAAKKKAYSVSEVEVLNPSAQAAYVAAARKAVAAAGGHSLRTTAGRVVQIDGAAPPKNVAITEWDSLDDLLAFYKSKVWTDLAPDRDKAAKLVRRYAVETEM